MADLNGKRILITGGFGYIGKHVVRAFEGSGAIVEVWDKKQPFKKTGVLNPDWTVEGQFGWLRDLPQFKYATLDIVEQYKLVEHYKNNLQFDVVIHLAAVSSVPEAEADPGKATRVNVQGTVLMLELAEKWDALFLNADSAMSPLGGSVYAETKGWARKLVRGYPKGVNLTLFNVAGASDDGLIGEDHVPETHFIPNLVASAITASPFILDSNPKVKRDFIHVCDVAAAFRKAVDRHFEYNLEIRDYDVGRGVEVSLGEVVDDAREILNWEFPIVVKNSKRFEPYDYNENLHFCAKFENWIPGWKPYGGYLRMLETQYKFAVKRLRPVLPA